MLYQILSGNFNIVSVLMGILATTIIIMVILPFHELAHGFVAYKLGDDTAKRQGRLTFNPLAHINYMGAVCLLLVGFGWAEPVPVNYYRLKNPKRDMALVALAGPVANLIAAVVGELLVNLFLVIVPLSNSDTVWYSAVVVFFYYYVQVNVNLAVFNLIPLPPLDGSKILGAFLPEKAYQALLMNERNLSMILMILLVTNVIDKIMDVPCELLMSFVEMLAWLPFMPFFGSLG